MRFVQKICVTIFTTDAARSDGRLSPLSRAFRSAEPPFSLPNASVADPLAAAVPLRVLFSPLCSFGHSQKLQMLQLGDARSELFSGCLRQTGKPFQIL